MEMHRFPFVFTPWIPEEIRPARAPVRGKQGSEVGQLHNEFYFKKLLGLSQDSPKRHTLEHFQFLES